MRYNSIRKMDISNGPGCRVSIFTQGCVLHCEGCFNSSLWDKTKGKEWTTETTDLLLNLLSKDYIKGLSILGGEPTEWSDELVELCTIIKDKYPSKDIWLYSGYTYEEILDNVSHKCSRRLLNMVDILVDGPFMIELKDTTLPFRGSSNQRIIDVKQSLIENRVILYKTEQK